MQPRSDEMVNINQFWIFFSRRVVERHWHFPRWQRNQEYISDVPSILSSSAQGQGHWYGFKTGHSLLMAKNFAQILFCGVLCAPVENCISSWPFERVCIIGKGVLAGFRSYRKLHSRVLHKVRMAVSTTLMINTNWTVCKISIYHDEHHVRKHSHYIDIHQSVECLQIFFIPRSSATWWLPRYPICLTH